MDKQISTVKLDESVTIETVLTLLPSQATLEQVKTFLASKGLSFSAGNWETMIDQKLRPAYSAGKISLNEFADFLASVEEHGKQHVLLYKCNAKLLNSLFATDHVKQVCNTESRFPMINVRSIVDMPSTPTIVEVRNDVTKRGNAIVAKVVEKRHLLQESTRKEWEENGRLMTSVETRPYRAANVVRICEDGICEIRIHSHSDAYAYEMEATVLVNSLEPLIGYSDLVSMSLLDARNFAVDPRFRTEAKRLFDLRHTEYLDLADGRLRSSVGGMSQSMLDNVAVTSAIDAFQKEDSSVHRAGLRLKKVEGLRRGLNLGLSGADNEFFLTAKVTTEEYETVLNLLLTCMTKMNQ